VRRSPDECRGQEAAPPRPSEAGTRILLEGGISNYRQVPLERQISDANVLKQSVRYSIPVPAPRVMVGDRRRRPPTQRKVPPIPQRTMWRCSLSEQSKTRGADGRLGSGHGPVSPNDSKASRTDCFRHLAQLTNSGDERMECEANAARRLVGATEAHFLLSKIAEVSTCQCEAIDDRFMYLSCAP